ncbi:MAG: ATP-binding protein [Crenarchaeota archaeon]|nr:ATP-binding protein [Thermoproteota archaeon]
MALELGEPLGYVVDGATPTSARFVSTRPPPVGDYVVIEAGGDYVLGMVRSVGTRSLTLSSLPGVYDPVVVEKLSAEAGAGDVFFECSARLLATLSGGSPRLPPLPGARVYRAPSGLLARLFGGAEGRSVRVGVLATRPDVEVRVDVNTMVTRHTAILAVTGAGKSNTVAVVADRLVRGYNATLLIFDFHGEYVGSSIGGGVNVIEPRLNPRHLSISELMTLLGVEHRFYHQERVLRKALEKVESDVFQGSFIDGLRAALEGSARQKGDEGRAAVALLNKLDSLLERYGDILDDTAVDPVSGLEPGRANVLDLSRVDEDAADVIVSHVLRILLWERKLYKLRGSSRVPFPVLVVLEEAHILAPRDEDTLSKYWLARVAREGRKFGLGLMLVSQRPKGLDQDILSQANNMIVMRLVEPTDQRYVQAASEALSEDLLEHLPSLATGEAVLVGPFTPLPALVKIDRFEGRLGGSDPDVVEEWTRTRAAGSPAEPGGSELYEEFL